ncbi:hypothetical protein [Flexivirga oryzae]|uniref:Cytoskeletal protein RodZ n=1 Tax=Flexivirga oryzae TaxID=1794944 RepID=A0A839N498_9MICO|nr:hypothetical protein [Flexivirga oryzae]MBB2890803.1 cytoskeletal protein RodZ [Flexivirga oryzae]
MNTKTKHIIGYSGTAVVALIIGAAAGSGGSSGTATPAVTSTVRTTATVTAPAPDAQPASAVTTTVHAPAVTKTVHAPAVTKTVTTTPKPKATIPGDGTYQVGTDIQPGTYVSGTPDSGNCYWARLKGTSGSFSDIIANNNSAGQSVVTIAPTDKVFETSGCNDWSRR